MNAADEEVCVAPGHWMTCEAAAELNEQLAAYLSEAPDDD